jgi:hypothetical protein
MNNKNNGFFMCRILDIIIFILVPCFAYSQVNVIDRMEIGKDESVGWEAIETKLNQHPFIILYVGDASESYKEKVDFIDNELDLKVKVDFILIQPERIKGGDEVRRILDDNLSINSCYILTTRKCFLTGSLNYLEEKDSTKPGIYLFKFLKNRCVVNQLVDFKQFFNIGDGKITIENYKHNKAVIDSYEAEINDEKQSKRDSATVQAVVNGVGGYLHVMLKKPAAVCINSTFIYWRPYQRNFSDGIGVVSNSRSANLMLSQQIYLGDNLDSALKPTLNFGIGYSFGDASIHFSRERSRLGLLNGEDRFPVLITDEVQSRIKSRALLFPLELGGELRKRLGKGHLAIFGAIGWWTFLQQLSIEDLTQQSKDLFILDANSGLEIRDVNVLNQYDQALISNEVNQFSIGALANIKGGLSYVSRRFSYALSYSLFKSVINDSFTASYVPDSGAQMQLFNGSRNLGHAFGFGISYKL